MPTVRATRQVTLAPLPGARKQASETALSTGVGVEQAKGEVGQALSQFGNVATNIATRHVSEIVDKETRRANSMVILKAQNEIDLWRNKAETEALSMKGDAANGLPEKMIADYNELTSKLETSMTPDQRELFMPTKLRTGADIDLTMRRHVMREMDAAEAGEMNAKLKNSVNSAMHNALDPPKVYLALDDAMKAVQEHGKNIGMGPKAIKEKIDEVSSDIHAGVVRQLLALDKDKLAKIYFASHRDGIEGGQLASLVTALDEGSTRTEARKAADDIIAKGGTLTEQRAQAKNIDDSKTRAAVEQLLEHEDSVKDSENRRVMQEHSDQAYSILDKTPDISRIPIPLWSSLPGPTRRSLQEYAENKVRGLKAKTDDTVWADLWMQAAMDPDKFLTKTDLNAYRSQLSDHHFEQLVELKSHIMSGNNAAAQKSGLGDFQTNMQVVNQTLEQYGIPTSGKEQTPENKNQAAQIYRMVSDEMAAEADRTHKAPDQAFVQEVADRLITAKVGMRDKDFFGVPLYKRLIDMTIQDVPADEKKDITDRLQKRNKPVNDQTILDYYIRARAPQRRGGQ